MRARRFVRFAPLVIIGLFLIAWVVMALWNVALVPATGWHPVTYWQALGLLILSKILFGGFAGGRYSDRRRRMWERWEEMTPEEREKFREGMRSRCWGHEATPPPAQ